MRPNISVWQSIVLLASMLIGIACLFQGPESQTARPGEKVLSPPETSWIRSIGISPDDRRLAAAGWDGIIRLWDLRSDELAESLKRHDQVIHMIDFSNDGKLLASASADGAVKLLASQTLEEIRTLDIPEDQARGVAFSPDSLSLVTIGRGPVVRLWEVATGREVRSLQGHAAYAISVAYSPDGSRVAAGAADGSIRLWDPATGIIEAVLRGHVGQVLSLAFSPDGKVLASVSPLERVVRQWDVASGRELETPEVAPYWLRVVKYSPDGRTLAAGLLDGTVMIWNSTGKICATLKGHAGIVHALAFTSDGLTLASGGDDGRLRLWNLAVLAPSSRTQSLSSSSEHVPDTYRR